jgi:hypothetical protein
MQHIFWDDLLAFDAPPASPARTSTLACRLRVSMRQRWGSEFEPQLANTSSGKMALAHCSELRFYINLQACRDQRQGCFMLLNRQTRQEL